MADTYLSASSSTRTSSSFTLTASRPFPSKNSSTRPGVPIAISAPVSKNLFTSSAGEESEETRSNGGGLFGTSVAELVYTTVRDVTATAVNRPYRRYGRVKLAENRVYLRGKLPAA